jgi:hypothetical protein
MKPRTYDKAKAVVAAAEKEPEKYGDLPERGNFSRKRGDFPCYLGREGIGSYLSWGMVPVSDPLKRGVVP